MKIIETHNLIRGGDSDAQDAMRDGNKRIEAFLVEEGRKANEQGYGFRCLCVARHWRQNGAGDRWTFAERMRMIREAFRP